MKCRVWENIMLARSAELPLKPVAHCVCREGERAHRVVGQHRELAGDSGGREGHAVHRHGRTIGGVLGGGRSRVLVVAAGVMTGGETHDFLL